MKNQMIPFWKIASLNGKKNEINFWLIEKNPMQGNTFVILNTRTLQLIKINEKNKQKINTRTLLQNVFKYYAF